MVWRATPATEGKDDRAEKRLLTISLGVVIGYLVSLIALGAGHRWILDASGHPIPIDFVAVWSAGRLALQGHALSAYDGSLQHAAEAAAIGRGFAGYYGWPYPPSFLLVAAALASLPYGWAFAAFVGGPLILHGVNIAAVVRRAGGAAVACAAPWALGCALVGQNGFLTAALMGFVLLTMDDRPRLSGIMLGLLAYKPQLGLLFPLALALSGRWRVFAWATASVLVVTGLSVAVFGVDVFWGFVRALPLTSHTLISDGAVGWNKLQSVYGLARTLGASDAAAWSAQATMAGACAVGVALLWRGRTTLALKAAGLAVATALATPYIFAYDLPILSVAAAFLYRDRRFDRLDYLALALAALALVPFLIVAVPTGLFASLAIAAAVGRRVIAVRPQGLAPPPEAPDRGGALNHSPA